MLPRALRKCVDGVCRAQRLDGVAQLVCGPCCDGGDCYFKMVPCPSGGDCALSGPSVYIPCAAAVCPDGEPIGGRVITFPGDQELAGWCFRYENDPECWYYTTAEPPPPNYCPLPPDAIVRESGWECVADCSDPVCEQRGAYLRATVCAGECGTTEDVLVCLSAPLDLSRCWWLHVGDTNGDFCGCISLGPQSRPYEGDPTGFRIVYSDPDRWTPALDPQSACCECCGTHCQRCHYERIPVFGITCIPGGTGRYCCCGQDKRVIAVVFASWRQHFVAATGFENLQDRKNNSTVTVRHFWDGSSWDKECLGLSAQESFYQQTKQNGNVIFEDYDANQARSCAEATVDLGRDNCITLGQDMAVWPGSARVWPFAHPAAGFSNWVTILQELTGLIDPNQFRCNGGTVHECVSNTVCTGSWSATGGCGRGSYTASIRRVLTTIGGDVTTTTAEIRVFMYSIIDGWEPDCEGGCARRTPREIGDTGPGAGDFL